jgi:PAS domain S-box-containing protein
VATTDGAIAEALGSLTSSAILVLQPRLDSDGNMFDAEIVWANDLATQREPAVRAGALASTLALSHLGDAPSSPLVVEAWQQPGVTHRRAAFPLTLAGVDYWFEAAAVRRGDLVVLTFDDRTEQQLQRREVEESEHRFRELLDGLDAGVVLLRPVWNDDIDGIGRFEDAEIVWANEASRHMWKDQEGLAAGTRVATVYYDAVDWIDHANLAWRGLPQNRLLQADPTVANWTSAQEVLRRVGDVIVELTVDRTNDQELLDQIAALDHRYAALIDDLPLTVMVLRIGHDDLEFVSPNASSLTGYPLHELRTIQQWDDLIIDDDRSLRRQLAEGVLSDRDQEAHWRIRRRTGEIVHISIRAARRDGPHGPQVVALVADITEQRRLMERIAIGDRLETLGRTAGSIAHDFNNLLMIASGNIDRARARLANTPELDVAASATGRASRLANSLLAFASGKPGEPRAIAVKEVLTAILPILRSSLPAAVTIRTNIDDNLPPIWADANHLEQVLLNLVANSRIAMGEHGTLTIAARTVTAARCHQHHDDLVGHEWVLLEVSDTGVGVTEDHVSRVWEPFFTTRRSDPEPGAGLGMSTVHGIVHQYGGHVVLDSTVGVGTTVSAYLPTYR